MPNESDFNALSEILRKLTHKKFFGKIQFTLNDGNIVHIDNHQTVTANELRKMLDLK